MLRQLRWVWSIEDIDSYVGSFESLISLISTVLSITSYGFLSLFSIGENLLKIVFSFLMGFWIPVDYSWVIDLYTTLSLALLCVVNAADAARKADGC